MKTLAALTFCMLALLPARAQHPSFAYSHGHYGRSYDYYRPRHVSYYPGYPRYGYGYGIGYGTYGSYGSVGLGYSQTYYSGGEYRRPNYAVSGLMLGGLTGAILGNNSFSHNSWEAAAVGAGAGLVLGSIAEHGARKREAREAEEAKAVVIQQNFPTAQAVTPVAPVVSPSKPQPTSPMSSANGMFGR